MRDNLTNSNLLSISKVAIDDAFFTPYINLVKEVVIPYQWEVLNDNIPDADKSHVIKNFRIAAGLEEGEFYGFFFQDTDLAKWLEAVAYSLQTTPDEGLEKLADDAIELVGLAQHKDGYINTYFSKANADKRWVNLEECHELYTAGHFIEAGVAYYEATGKRNLLDIVCKFADYIDSVFGPEPEKKHGYDGHQEIELALVRLYRVTDDVKYLNLSKYFIDARGTEPYYFAKEWEDRGEISYWSMSKIGNPDGRRKYVQTHLPVREQKEAVGHAVRVVYMLTGMAEVANECKDYELLKACQTLWENIVTKQMYITGGIGSTAMGEAFTFDYDLPNDTVYAETCASIGLINFAQRMLQIENKRCYSDVIEKALYNIIISSMSRDGKHFFYVNPLEVWPDASRLSPIKEHVKAERRKWFGCACCPPNLARLITSLGQYIYTASEDTLYVHQFISNKAKVDVGGENIGIKTIGNYPWDGNIKFELELEKEAAFNLAIRIPSWCKNSKLTVDGEEIDIEKLMVDGYVYVNKVFHNGSVIELVLDMPVTFMQANVNVRADIGKVAIQRGPVVYCLEETDNGRNLPDIMLNFDSNSKVEFDDSLLSGGITIVMDGTRTKEDTINGDLYKEYTNEREVVKMKAIPYCMWGNRNPGEMLVWVRA